MGCGRSSQVGKCPSGQDLKGALTGGSVEALRRLVDISCGGRDPNLVDIATGDLPLVLAARSGASVDAFGVLLAAGADPSSSSNSRPLLGLLAEWEDKEKSRDVAEVLLQHGLDVSLGDEAPLLKALRYLNGPLAGVLIAHAASLDAVDGDGNTPLHIAGAVADATVVAAILQKGGGHAMVKNSTGLTPVMCARLGAIAPQKRLSKDWKWCQREVLQKREDDAAGGGLLEPGDEVWRCPAGRCFSGDSMQSPAFPQNHEVAAAIALAAGDAYSLTDAIEGAWLDGEAPPEKPTKEVHPDIMKAINTLVRVLQTELQKGLRDKDASRVEAGLEMLWYANVAKLPEEERAIKMLVRMKLEQAMASRQELELKQALMSASQYGQEDSPLFKNAQEALDQILEDRQIEMLVLQLTDAMEKNQLTSLHAVLQFGKSGKLKNGSTLTDHPEYARGEAYLQEVVRKELVQATATANRKAINLACARTRHYNVTHLQEFQNLLNLKKTEAVQYLQEATGKQTEEALQKGLRTAMEDMDLTVAGVRDEPAFKAAVQAYRDVLSLPLSLDDDQLLKLVTQGRADVVRKQVTNDILQTAFQDLFDMTWRKVCTKDRRVGELPKRLIVKEVVAVQNTDALIKYIRRREGIRKQLAGRESGSDLLNLGDPRSREACKTFCRLPDGKQFHTVWQEVDELSTEVIDPSINEFYLFHGTSPAAVAAITENDFSLDLAGTNAGTLYGRGVYFAESVTKSDEYAKKDPKKGLYPMLICRVTLGRIFYTDEEYPSTNKLIRQCTSGVHHSVLGDREKCRNTFREMIVYDTDQAYPEFVVWYSRET